MPLRCIQLLPVAGTVDGQANANRPQPVTGFAKSIKARSVLVAAMKPSESATIQAFSLFAGLPYVRRASMEYPNGAKRGGFFSEADTSRRKCIKSSGTKRTGNVSNQRAETNKFTIPSDVTAAPLHGFVITRCR